MHLLVSKFCFLKFRLLSNYWDKKQEHKKGSICSLDITTKLIKAFANFDSSEPLHLLRFWSFVKQTNKFYMRFFYSDIFF